LDYNSRKNPHFSPKGGMLKILAGGYGGRNKDPEDPGRKGIKFALGISC